MLQGQCAIVGSTRAIALRVARCLVASDRAAPVCAACRA